MTSLAALDLLRERRDRARGPVLSVGLTAAHPGHLAADLASIRDAGVEMVHVDVMDGVFAGPLTVGPNILQAIPDGLASDVHLMVHDPLASVEAFLEAGADLLTFHVESVVQARPVLRRIAEGPRRRERAGPVGRGIALNPSTPLEAVEPLLEEVDYVLLLAVDPGWPGGGFAPATARRIARVREIVAQLGLPVTVGIDGAVTRRNLPDVAALGPDVVVSGSAVFVGQDAPGNARDFLAVLAGDQDLHSDQKVTPMRRHA